MRPLPPAIATATCPTCQSSDASPDAAGWNADVQGLDQSRLDIILI
jgi:hypothetical protein